MTVTGWCLLAFSAGWIVGFALAWAIVIVGSTPDEKP